MKYIQYFSYLIKHKWFVFIAGLKVRAPIFRLIIHDWSKFLPNQWFGYMNYFYGEHPSWHDCPKYIYPYELTNEYWKNKFDYAWLNHIHKSPHHWQHFVLREDNGKTKYLEMPYKYIKEMVADWAGAGKAITGEWEVKKWYYKNNKKIKLHPNTRLNVEKLIERHF